MKHEEERHEERHRPERHTLGCTLEVFRLLAQVHRHVPAVGQEGRHERALDTVSRLRQMPPTLAFRLIAFSRPKAP